MSETDPAAMVVVMTAGSLSSADIIRATLESAGIPAFIPGENAYNTLMHLGPMMQSSAGGVPIMVRAMDLERAMAALKLPEQPQPPTDITGPTPDDYARKAYWSAWFAVLVFPPIMLISIWWFCRAAIAARTQPAERPQSFAWHLVIALVLSIVAVVEVVLILGLLPQLIDTIRNAINQLKEL